MDETNQNENVANPSSLSDVLKGETPSEVVAPVETATEKAPSPEVPASGTPAVEVKTEVTPTLEAPQPSEADIRAGGLLRAMQAERQKRQALEAELAQYKGELQSQPYVGEQSEPDPLAQVESKLSNKILSISEATARAAFPDYNEKFASFYEEAVKNPALRQSVIDSENPGLAAYEAGKMLLNHKKYGVDFESQRTAIRNEAREEMRAEIRAELEKELTGKALSKVNQPTNILSARAASGSDEAEFRFSGFKDVLARKK